MIINITGDGSYLGLVDPGAYKSFVGRDWASNPRLLEPHFIEQMNQYAGLFWDTGLEAGWRVELTAEKSDKSGYREATGSVKVTGGKLALLDYDALTMMAQFENHTLNEYLGENILPAENGNYSVRIVQLFDPKLHFPDSKSTDFLIEVVKTENLMPPAQSVYWSKLR